MATNYFIQGMAFADVFVKRDLFFQGGLWSSGYNVWGNLGDNTNTRRSSPVQTVAGGSNWKQVACGGYHVGSIKADGSLWIWGDNSDGQLGDNTITHRSSPVQTVSGGTNWKFIASGGYHTASIKTDGSLWLWGKNSQGQLGNNTLTSTSSPVQTLSGGTNWKQVACGWEHTAAIKTDGTLWTWGSGSLGELGDNTSTSKSVPAQTVSAGSNWKQVSAGHWRTAAIKTDGTLWLWGHNFWGALGDGTRTHRSSPVQTVSTDINWKQVACGWDHTAAIKTDGTLWSWGQNGYGQLGDNTVTHRSSPVQTVSGGTNWKQVATGANNTLSIKTDGTLWGWGRNDQGQLGISPTFTYNVSPIQTSVGGTNWKQISSGALTSSFIRDQW